MNSRICIALALAATVTACYPRVIPEERVAELRRACEGVGGYFFITTNRDSTTANTTTCLRK